MELNQYQEQARGTRLYPDKFKLVYPILALCGEAGEVANKVKKIIRSNALEFVLKARDGYSVEGENKKDLVNELGDVLWYISAALDDLGYTLEDCARMNLEKLARRKESNSIKDHK